MLESVLSMSFYKSFIVSGLRFRSLIHFEFIVVMVLESVLVSFFYKWLTSFPGTICYRDCLFSTVYSCLLCHRCVGLSLGFLFCSIDLYFCLCATTILYWWLWLCSRAWSQARWFLQFHSSFSRLLWQFEVFCISIQIMKSFVLALWKIPLVAW